MPGVFVVLRKEKIHINFLKLFNYIYFSQHNNKQELCLQFIVTCFDSHESSSGYDYNYIYL